MSDINLQHTSEQNMDPGAVGEFRDNTERHRFELGVEGKTAFIDYIINRKGVIYLTHTEVPKEAEGQGIASQIIELALSEVEKRGLKLVPICPFVKVYLQRHPEWEKLLAEDFR